MKDFEERFVSGYNKFLIKLSDKADLLQKVSLYYVITRQLEPIQQFTSGLSSYSLLSSLRKFKAQAEKEFIYSTCPMYHLKILARSLYVWVHGYSRRKS